MLGVLLLQLLLSDGRISLLLWLISLIQNHYGGVPVLFLRLKFLARFRLFGRLLLGRDLVLVRSRVEIRLLFIVVLGVIPQIIHFLRQNPSSREELIVIWTKSRKFFQILPKKSFSCDEVHSREVIYLLVWLHLS
jgi:hypothetical protein